MIQFFPPGTARQLCRLILTGWLVTFFSIAGNGQKSPGVSYGKVALSDLQVTKYEQFPDAAAVFIADVGHSEITGNDKGGFSLKFQRYFRIHVLKQEGSDAADVSLVLYVSRDFKEEIKDINGVTYNLEGGTVQETKLDVKNAVYTEKRDKNHVSVKFVMPGVKAGSIVECRYTIISDYIFNLQPWSFQNSYPHLWSEYNLELPQFFNYVSLTQGRQKYDINSQETGIKNYAVSQPKETSYGEISTERFTISVSVARFKWVMKNVPGLKEEPFTSALGNHFSRIEFQLAEIRKPLAERTVMSTWPQAAAELLKHENFRYDLDGTETVWLQNVVSKIVLKNDNELLRARKIFEHLRDNFTCVKDEGLFRTQPLQSVYKKKSGNVADINLLLVAMLRQAGMTADPVILSLRSNGFTHDQYPLMDRYNYVVCRVEAEGKPLLLDASGRHHMFNSLPSDCYNGYARIINEEAPSLLLTPDSLKETSQVTVFLAREGDNSLAGKLISFPGTMESVRLRDQIQKNGNKAVSDRYATGWEQDIKVQEVKADSLQKADMPLQVTMDFLIEGFDSSIIYFNPMMGQGYRKNPFPASERLYPVEMETCTDQTYKLELDMPDGYLVEELPKPLVMKLNEKGDASFEYKIVQTGNHLSLLTRTTITRTRYQPEEYEMLREFFSLVVKKHAEQIVFKKKP